MALLSDWLSKLSGAAQFRYDAPRGRIGRARVGVLTVIPEELEAARNALNALHNVPRTRYFVAEAGELRDWNVVVTQCMARSNVPSGSDVADMIDDVRPQILMLVGVAGGLTDNGVPREGIALGDVVIADYVSYVDFVKLTNTGVAVRHYALDHPSIGLNKNVSLGLSTTGPLQFEAGRPEGNGTSFRIHIGEVVSGEKIMGALDDPIQASLLSPYDKALAVDMESVGMARVVCDRRSSFWYHPRYAVIRGISDMVGVAGNHETRALWKAYAARTAAEVARLFIARLPHDKPAS